MYLTLLYLAIFAACVGFLYHEGTWSNAIRVINVVTAGLLTMVFVEPLSAAVASSSDFLKTLTYFVDFVVFWGLFAFTTAILSEITGRCSTVKVKFLMLADRIGSGALAACVGWIMVCLTATSLHMAPLPRQSFAGALDAEAIGDSSLSPEMLWLGFVQQVSLGAYARSPGEDQPPDAYVFDPKGLFLPTYATRRAKLEAHATKAEAVRILPERWRDNY